MNDPETCKHATTKPTKPGLRRCDDCGLEGLESEFLAAVPTSSEPYNLTSLNDAMKRNAAAYEDNPHMTESSRKSMESITDSWRMFLQAVGRPMLEGDTEAYDSRDLVAPLTPLQEDIRKRFMSGDWGFDPPAVSSIPEGPNARPVTERDLREYAGHQRGGKSVDAILRAVAAALAGQTVLLVTGGGSVKIELARPTVQQAQDARAVTFNTDEFAPGRETIKGEWVGPDFD